MLPKDCWASTEAIDTGHRRRSLGKEIARFKVEIPQKVTVSTCEANENEWQTFNTSWVWVWYHWMRNSTSSSIQYSHPSFQQEDHLLNWDKQNQFWRKPFYFQHLFNHHLAIWWLTIYFLIAFDLHEHGAANRFNFCLMELPGRPRISLTSESTGKSQKQSHGEPNAHLKKQFLHTSQHSLNFPSMWLSWQLISIYDVNQGTYGSDVYKETALPIKHYFLHEICSARKAFVVILVLFNAFARFVEFRGPAHEARQFSNGKRQTQLTRCESMKVICIDTKILNCSLKLP